MSLYNNKNIKFIKEARKYAVIQTKFIRFINKNQNNKQMLVLFDFEIIHEKISKVIGKPIMLHPLDV